MFDQGRYKHWQEKQPSLGCLEKIRLSHRLASYLRARFKHFLTSYDQSETTSCMQFVAILYISGLRCLIRYDTNIGKKRNPHWDAQKDRLPQRLATYLWARFKHFLEVVWQIWDQFWHAIRSNTVHFRPQINDTKIIDFLIHRHTVRAWLSVLKARCSQRVEGWRYES